MDSIHLSEIMQQFAYANELYEKTEFEKSKKILVSLIEEVESFYHNLDGNFYSFGHVSEVYMFLYIKNKDKKIEDLNIRFTEIDLSMFYRLLGLCNIHLGRKQDAIKAYDAALKWNPVDLDSLFQIIELYKAVGRIDSVRKAAKEAYSYCCTRATLAHYYRDIGFYYLEKYKPEVAVAAYQYSNIFYYHDSAKKELEYLNNTKAEPYPEYSVSELQKILSSENIPLGPSKETVQLLLQLGDLEFEQGEFVAAKDCYTMIYDLIKDAEIEDKLRQVNAKINMEES